jgi:DNA repair protein RecO (recombination protein O)
MDRKKMSYLKTKGIVIKEVNTGEADKIITIFAKGYGKIAAAARGARRSKSTFVAGSQLLCYSDFVLFKGRDMFSVNSCDVIEPFYEIRNDIVKLTYSAHLVELISDVIQENQPSTRLLQLFLNSLHMLTKTEKSPELISRIFEIRLLSIMGYAPYVRACIVCGCEDDQSMNFSFKKCGIICSSEKCADEDRYAMEISPGTVRALRHIVHSSMSELFGFDLSPDVLEELGRISRRYLRDRLEKEYNKLDYLKVLGEIK